MPFADPESNVSHLHLSPGMRVADFGAGSGFYAIPLAKKVGGKGRVFAVDVQKDLLAKLRNDVRRKGYYNIEVVWGNLDHPNGSKLATHSADAVVISNILFQSENKITFLNEAKRVLKPGGELLLIDWTGAARGIGPSPADVLTELKARELLESVGFEVEHSFNAGDHHYGLVCKNI
jgi:ubiquinone/menaquinone biosynthesis C-methylase UbiE